MNIKYIGVKETDLISSTGLKVVGVEELEEQLEYIEQYDCELHDENDESIDWSDLEEREVEVAIFKFLRQDRKKRIDNQMLMTYMTPFAIASYEDGKVKRLEYHECVEGSREKVVDYRSLDLKGEDLQNSFMQFSLGDPNLGYDVGSCRLIDKQEKQ